MRLPNQNPNELAGSEVRPQPPHCDKNSYIFRITSFPVLLRIIRDKRLRVNRFVGRRSSTFSSVLNSLAASVNLPCVVHTEEVSELAIVAGVVDHEVRNLARFE